MQFVSVDVVFHEKQRVAKFLCYIFSIWFRSNTEQFLFNGWVEMSTVTVNGEPQILRNRFKSECYQRSNIWWQQVKNQFRSYSYVR